MAEKKIIVFIYLPGKTRAVPAGIFTHKDDVKIGTFIYGRRYIERKNALSVDPVALPLGMPSREAFKNGGLYGAFRDASPDYWGRLVISANSGIPSEAFSEIDFLLEANATRVGNLDFRLSPQDPEPELMPPHFNELEKIMEASRKIQAGEKADEHLLQLIRQGSSMGGARPKCTVEWKDSLWIAKFPAKGDTLNIPRIEYATMFLASVCGIRIPEISIEKAGGKEIFLSMRFDREKKGNNWTRKGFLSALSLMEWDEREYHLWDYASIADTMRRHTSTKEIRELFRRMVFNIMVSNTDDHPRNHGFLANNKISLSPAYDIVPDVKRPGIGTRFNLAMSIGNKGKEATIDNALSRCERFGFSKAEAKEEINKMAEIIKNWRGYYEDRGVSGRDIDALEPSFNLFI